MSHLEKRLTALERRHGDVMPHTLFMPFDLSEAEKIEWDEEHTSHAALAAAGIPPNGSIILVTFFGSKDDTPAGVAEGPK